MGKKESGYLLAEGRLTDLECSSAHTEPLDLMEFDGHCYSRPLARKIDSSQPRRSCCAREAYKKNEERLSEANMLPVLPDCQYTAARN